MGLIKFKRRAKPKKIGLALGGGAARGLVHIGVLQVLERENIPIDFITGTSAGAIFGAFYADGRTTEDMKNFMGGITRKRLIPIIDLGLPHSGFLKGERVRKLLSDALGNIDFDQLKIPFACVATDIDTGEEVILNKGSVPEAVRASISIPGIFSVVKKEGRFLVDGGLVNQVPVDLVRDMGADFVIAVNVIPDATERIHRIREQGGKTKEPNIVDAILQSIYISSYALARSNLHMADVVIEPDTAHISAGDFFHMEEAIRLGATTTERAMPLIREKLGRKR